MNGQLYEQAIKELARAAHGAGRLDAADGTALLDNPFCGDRVRVDVALRDGRIRALAHETKGCLLCRASASVLGLRAPGCTPGEIGAIRHALREFLEARRGAPPVWEELGVFAPAQAYPSRHGCVMLAFEAAQAALASSG
jgi:nitrogen fixation NifU-like protein